APASCSSQQPCRSHPGPASANPRLAPSNAVPAVSKEKSMRALITGVTGQDGSYMAELLLEKGYEVFGLIRRSSTHRFDRIESLLDDIELVEADLSDQTSLDGVILNVRPDEVYNLAAQSFVPVSWSQPALTGDVTGLGVLRMLEAIRKHRP